VYLMCRGSPQALATWGGAESHLGAVRTLVYVFVQVLDGLDGGAHVDVAVVIPAKERVVRDHLDAWKPLGRFVVPPALWMLSDRDMVSQWDGE